MAKKRLTRKQLLKEPDEFITSTGRVVQWARNNTKPLTYGTIAFFIAVILAAGFNYYQDRRRMAAASLLGQATAKYQSELDAGAADIALSAVRNDFEQLIQSYGGQPAGQLGRLIFAHVCLTGGAVDEAIAHYRGVLDHYSADPSLLNIILNGLGSAFQRKGEDLSATTYYQQMVDSDSSVLKDAALFNLGLLLDRMGKLEEMKKVYEQLVAEFPESFYANLVREKI